jgi:hypothetical protein
VAEVHNAISPSSSRIIDTERTGGNKEFEFGEPRGFTRVPDAGIHPSFISLYRLKSPNLLLLKNRMSVLCSTGSQPIVVVKDKCNTGRVCEFLRLTKAQIHRLTIRLHLLFNVLAFVQ